MYAFFSYIVGNTLEVRLVDFFVVGNNQQGSASSGCFRQLGNHVNSADGVESRQKDRQYFRILTFLSIIISEPSYQRCPSRTGLMVQIERVSFRRGQGVFYGFLKSEEFSSVATWKNIAVIIQVFYREGTPGVERIPYHVLRAVCPGVEEFYTGRQVWYVVVSDHVF